MRFEDRFTERAKKSIELAYSSAAELGHGYVGSEHILLGLLREDSGVAAKVLQANGLDEAKLLSLIESAVGKGVAVAEPAQGLTPRTKRIIERSLAEAARLGHS